MDFKEIYNKTNNKYKDDFLYKILQDNTTLKNKFLEGNNTNESEDNKDLMSFADFKSNIEENYEENKEMMESLDLEETDWENYTPRHSGYIEEWEASQHMAEDEADELFEFFEPHLVTLLLQNNIEEIFVELISFYFAAKDAEINDPYENLGDEYFIYSYKDFVENITEKISHATISDVKIINTITLFFKYFEQQEKEKHSRIKPFEQLLILLIEKIDNYELLLPYEKLTSIDSINCPVLSVNIDEKLGNNDAWLEKSHQTMLADNEIGQKLLDYYLKEDFLEYLNVAKKLFKHDKDHWANIISKNIKLSDDKEFYKNIHKHLCIHNNKIINYLNIRLLLTHSEKEALHNEIYSEVYRVKIYEVEKDYKKIKKLVENDINSWNFNEIIEPILNIYPEFCFKLIEKKCYKKIQKERGRDVYIKIASWLVQAKKITSFKSQTLKLINNLYNHKPNLPALKDEFRKNGLY